MTFDVTQATAGLHALVAHFMQRLPYMATLRVRWWVQPPRHFELSQGLDTVLLHIRDALRAARARGSAPPQAVPKQGG